jgi:general secretion pathway protein D
LPQSETELEVTILELNESQVLELGLKLPSSISLSPAGFGIAPQGGFAAGATAQAGVLTLNELQSINQGNVLVNLGSPSVTLNLNQTTNATRLLANPKIRVKNREKAKIQIGDRVPVVTTTTNLGVTSEMITYQDVGLSLEVEPTISQDSEIGVKLALEVSNISGTTTTKTGLTAYQIGQRKANTVLTLVNGETQMLGGLISSNNSGAGTAVPGAANVPVLNRLLGSRKDSNDKTELVLLITPRIVRNVPIPAPHVLQFPSGTESDMTTQPLTLRSAPAAR